MWQNSSDNNVFFYFLFYFDRVFVVFLTQKRLTFYFDRVCFQETIFSSNLAQTDKQTDICPITISQIFYITQNRTK